MNKNFQQLWKDFANSTDEAVAVRVLAGIVADKEGRAFVSRLGRDDAEYCIYILDRGLAGGDLKIATEKQAFFNTLRRLSGIHGRLPESMMIVGEIEVRKYIHASGGWADVRTGKYGGRLVALKSLRVSMQDDLQKIRKKFCKGVVFWSTLDHPHVSKLVGVYGDLEKDQFITVSEWMEHGNIVDYIKKNHANRLELLHGAARGLKYIHWIGIAHGNLKGANILVSGDTPPRACLADFGFMSVVPDPYMHAACDFESERGNITFMSPELLVPSFFGMKDSNPVQETDIYAFGLVVFLVLTGQTPFRDVRITELGFAVFKGHRPGKPVNASAIGFSDSLWGFTQRCWDGDMNSRPKVTEVVQRLADAAAGWHGLMPPGSQTEDVVYFTEDPAPDSTQHGGTFGPPRAILEGSVDPPEPTSRPSGSLVQPLNHSPPGATEIIAESKRRSSQRLINRIDQVPGNTVRNRDRYRLLNTLRRTRSRLTKFFKAMHVGISLYRRKSPRAGEAKGRYARPSDTRED